jgi:hypothetical protein
MSEEEDYQQTAKQVVDKLRAKGLYEPDKVIPSLGAIVWAYMQDYPREQLEAAADSGPNMWDLWVVGEVLRLVGLSSGLDAHWLNVWVKANALWRMQEILRNELVEATKKTMVGAEVTK